MRSAAYPLLLCLAAAFPLMAQVPDCGLVPGWQQSGPARSYVADNLFEYMDGNAEGYLIYQFVSMRGVTCKSGENTILFDVSTMADAESAYGLFCANRDPRLPLEKIGMGGQAQPRKAIFAKDKYFVELSASPDKDHSPALRAFAAAMEKAIPGTTDIPTTIGWFPTEKLAPESVRLVPQSVLGLRLLKRGYIAQYEYGKAFIVSEASAEAASALIARLKARIGETVAAPLGDEAFQANDRYLGRLCFFRKGRHIAGFANLAEGADPAAAAQTLLSRLPAPGQ